VTVTEPEWTKERRYSKTAPIVPFPAVAITYLAPEATSPDVPALRLIQSILSGGESSRLHRALVREKKIAQNAEFEADIRVDKGLLLLLGIASDTGTSESMEKAFFEEIRKMQESPVSAQELEKAKNQLITRAVRQRENNDGRAIIIERAIEYQGDPKAVNKEVELLQKVTAADIQRVMKKYFKDNNRVVIYYNQAENTEGEDNEK